MKDGRHRPEQTGTDEALVHVTPGRDSSDACQAAASLETDGPLLRHQQKLHGHQSGQQ